MKEREIEEKNGLERNKSSSHPHVQVCQKDKTTLSFSGPTPASVLFIFGPRVAGA